MEQDDDSKFEENKFPKFVDKVSNDAKLKELLRNLSSTEIRISSYASKEFIKLLKDDNGGLLLREYVLSSYNCLELLQAWKLALESSGSNNILSLISTFLAHPDGMYKAIDTDPQRLVISRALDKVARSMIDQNLKDIYKELNSKEAKHQKAALLLLTAIVRRGSSLASDVAKSFDFKLPVFIKLADYKQKKNTMKKKHSTRKPFVGFAMSFLEVGNPRLLRWVLQQREMYSAVLRGLGDDDEETIVYVLSTLLDKVLVPGSLIPPGLRSVLFGSVTLDKLINISSRCDGDVAAELAHSVLVAVCTDPSNGLMPDLTRQPSPLRGNPKRLLDLMKKLKATEIEYHQDLLLAIVKGRPSLACLYMDEYPYNLEDHASPSWFAAVSLAADVISSVGSDPPFSFVDSLRDCPPSFNSSDVQCVMKCICPKRFTRLVINKGLLHKNSLVKHGTLKLVLESLKLLDSFMSTIECNFYSDGQVKRRCFSLKTDIQNVARTLLPDPQVLLSLLSSLSRHYKSLRSCLKRKRGLKVVLEEGKNAAKKLKTAYANEDVDILVSGVGGSLEIALPAEDAIVEEIKNVYDLNNRDGHINVVADIWGLDQCSLPTVASEDEETHFYSKLLDTLRYYHRTVPAALEGSFDFFKVMPSDLLSLPIILQQSLLSLLVEVIGWSANSKVPIRIPPMLYKHLQPFINMLLSSQSKDIKEQAYILAKAAILSTGAFTRNLREIDVWFLFLSNFSMNDFVVGDEGIEVLRDLFLPVVNFLCDAVSTIGNNPFKYWNLVRDHMYRLNGLEDVSPEFSPLVVCVLEKCLRVLHSESGTFNLTEKTVISLYVCNTVKYILQTQVEAGFMSSLIDILLSEKVVEHCSSDDSGQVMCEWQPLMNLLLFARGTENQQIFNTSLESYDSSFVNVLSEVEKVLRSGSDSGLVKVTKAFVFSLISTPPAVVLKHFPSVLCISRDLFRVPFSMLLLIFSLEPNFMNDIFNLWPDMLKTGMQWAARGGCEEELDRDTHIDSITSASVEFSLFMRQAPYLVLMPMILSISIPELFVGPLLTTMLLSKLSDLDADKAISLIRPLLFWGHRIRLNYPSKSLALCESLFQVCSTLISKMLKVILNPTDSGCKSTPVTFLSQYMAEAAEVIYSHPLVLLSMECPVGNERKFPKAISGNTLEDFLHLTEKDMLYLNSAIFNFLPAFPENALDFLFHQNSLTEVGQSLEHYKKSSIALAKRVLYMFRDRFGNFMQSGDLKPLAPAFYVFHKLINIFSPKDLFELVDWIFSRISICDLAVHGSVEHSAMSFGLWIAGYSFDMLSAWLQQSHKRVSLYIKLSALEVMSFDLPLFEKVYFRVVDIAIQFEMEYAVLCLLKAVDVAKILKDGNDQCITSSLDITKVILNTPLRLVSHFIKKTSRTGAKMLSSLIDISPVHLSVFGHLLSDMMSEFVHPDGSVTKRTYESATLDYFLMLLPVAVSYLNLTLVKQKELYTSCRDISSFYCTMLLHSFLDWSNFVSQDLFKVEGDETLYLSVDNQFDLISGSLLTNTILMLENHFTSNKDAPLKPKKRLKLFDSVCSEFFSPDRDIGETNVGVSLSLDSANRIIAKVNFCRMLLFPKTNQTYLEMGSHKEDSSRIKLMKMLVGTWDWIAHRYPFSSGNLQSRDLLKNLEAFLLRNILELTRAVGKHLIDQSPFTGSLEKLARSVLLNRFNDPETLIMLHSIVMSIPDNKLHVLVLQLLLAHSQFAPTIHSARKSHDGSQFGVTVKPMASILRFLVIPSADRTTSNEERCQPLEVVKLLKALLLTVSQQPGFSFPKDIGVNSQELLFLLLSSYGATLEEIDLEIYKLMDILDSDKEMNSGSIAEMDFLWGSAANIRKDQEIPFDEVSDLEAIEERRRRQFREKLPINPRICANTVLNFPYYRTVGEETLPDYISENVIETPYWSSDKLQTYDPVYILRFSIHCLSMAYIEPMEFASLSLLSIVFVSISSPDEEMRKLGYEAIGRFKTALEKGQKRKQTMLLRLLLMYIQNGIEEPWQRIPSIIALFAAEASCILLDPLHDHYLTISKHLMHSPKVNMKSVPLFQSLLWSTSVTFKSDRIWILRLLYAGLNSEEDCQLYVRNDIIETLLGCYASLPSDNEAKELILQVVKKSLRFRGMAHYLVEHCGLISWLSSVVSIFIGIQFEDQRNLPLTMLVTILEVANEVAGDDTLEWLQKFSFEQLSELSTHVCELLVGSTLIQEHMHVVSSILKILTSTLKISQKRELYQTHFTLSIEAMFHIYEAVNKCRDTTYCDTAEVLLTAVLTSTPPVAILSMDEEKLMKFLNWATSTAIRLDSAKARLHRDGDSPQVIYSEEDQSKEDSMISKLLRWLTASVILQRHSNGSLGLKFSFERSKPKTLLSLLEHVKEQGEGSHTLVSGCEEILVTNIFHLQQLLGTNYRLLPSVVSALCLLQFPDLSHAAAEITSFPDNQNDLSSLLRKIRCPVEVNTAWRWSFDQPWEVITSKYTDSEKLDELQACRSFWLIISNFIGYKKSLLHTLSLEEVEKSGVFSWERSLLLGK